MKMIDLITFVNGVGRQPGQDSASNQGGDGEKVDDQPNHLHRGELSFTALQQMFLPWRQYEEDDRQGKEEAGYKQLRVEKVKAGQQIDHVNLLAEGTDEEGGDRNCKQGEEGGIHPEPGDLVYPHTLINSRSETKLDLSDHIMLPHPPTPWI